MAYKEASCVTMRRETKDELEALLYRIGLAEKFASWDAFFKWIIKELREEYLEEKKDDRT